MLWLWWIDTVVSRRSAKESISSWELHAYWLLPGRRRNQNRTQIATTRFTSRHLVNQYKRWNGKFWRWFLPMISHQSPLTLSCYEVLKNSRSKTNKARRHLRSFVFTSFSFPQSNTSFTCVNRNSCLRPLSPSLIK